MGRPRRYATNAERQAAWRHNQGQKRLSQIQVVHGAGYTVYHGDALTLVPLLRSFDHCITDPPYEQEAHTRMRRTRAKLEGRSPYAPVTFAPISEAQRRLVTGLRCQWLLVFCQAEAIDAALATIADSGADALMVAESALLNAHRQCILDFARTHRLPTVCGVRAYAEAGCLIAYATNLFEMHRRAAVFVDKLLKGAIPRDLPVERPTKFELVINLKTAQALGITIPPHLLVLADEVIQ
jgi:ABC transporter substrate binding protein